jgi:hypothetical protein
MAEAFTGADLDFFFIFVAAKITDGSRSFLKEIIEGGAGVARCARGRAHSGFRSSRNDRAGRKAVASYRNTRRKETARIRLVLHGNTLRDRFHALKARGRLKVDALLAAVQTSSALRAGTFEIDAGRQRGGTAKTSGGNYVLNKTRQSWSRDIQRKLRPWLPFFVERPRHAV